MLLLRAHITVKSKHTYKSKQWNTSQTERYLPEPFEDIYLFCCCYNTVWWYCSYLLCL